MFFSVLQILDSLMLFFQVKMVCVLVTHSEMIMDNERHVNSSINTSYQQSSTKLASSCPATVCLRKSGFFRFRHEDSEPWWLAF